jgi:alanine racemase
MPDAEGAERSRTSVRIDLPALEENYRAVRGLVSADTALLCVIKADAYGHGAVEVGRRLQSAGAPYFGVASIEEGRELRENGISVPILILSGVMPWERLDSAVDYDLSVAVGNFELLERICAFKAVRPLKLHVKIDTGMGRLGFAPGEIASLLPLLEDLRAAEVEGLMTHFPSSEVRDEFGLGQVALFSEVIRRFEASGINPRFRHMANSAAICNYPEGRFNMVRPGIMLYGCYADAALKKKVLLTPVMRWASSIAFVRTFPAGARLSYGGTYVTEKETRVGYVPVGYAHGYPRALSNRGSVIVAGRRCRVLGVVCMDWTFVDLTGVPAAKTGTEVVLLGSAEGASVTADEMARETGSIPYEILCGISRRFKRVYVP